jgi:hypothetical protein
LRLIDSPLRSHSNSPPGDTRTARQEAAWHGHRGLTRPIGRPGCLCGAVLALHHDRHPTTEPQQQQHDEPRISAIDIALAGYEDYPYGGYGSSLDGDTAYYLLHRAMTATTDPGLASLVTAVDLYQTRNGLDGPESGWEMVFQVATGAGSGTGLYAVPPFDPATAPPASIPEGEEVGEIGGAGIRSGSLPILVWITDAESHNSSVTGNPYGSIPGVTPATSAQALSAMLQIGGRIIGVLSGEAGRADLEQRRVFFQVPP